MIAKVYLDTNVIIDFLGQRQPFFNNAALIVSLAKKGLIKIYCASMSFATASYILSKHGANSPTDIRNLIGAFINVGNVTVVDRKTVEYSVTSAMADFEDAMQEYSALRSKCDVIVTRNKKDFVETEIQLMTPQEFIDSLV